MLPGFVSPTLKLGRWAPTQPPHSFPQGTVSRGTECPVLHLIHFLWMDSKVASNLGYSPPRCYEPS